MSFFKIQFYNATAEGEKEFLHDRLHTLLARNEDHEKELCELETKMHSLMMKNEELRRENESLKQELKGTLLLNKLYPEGK